MTIEAMTLDTVEVRTRAGRVRGFWREQPGSPARSAAFLGIPFAEPPVGALRFGAPVPHGQWDGVRDATRFGATAQRGDPGVTLIPEPSIPGESTLNVNVFTPDPSAGGLPVLVWIHGGGFIAGSPASPWYDGRAFARNGVVTVTVSYRLGFDGFGWIEDAPSNRAVRDWMLALEWVQENIAAFGGDPARVTIAGQSAGGGAVLTLLGMPKAQHLFRGVWALSGATADVPAAHAERIGRDVAQRAEVAPTRTGFSTLSEERVAHLAHAVAGPDLDAGITALVDGGLRLGPVVDGDLILRPTLDSIAAGTGAGLPLVLGATDDEFAMAVAGLADNLHPLAPDEVAASFGIPERQRDAYLAVNAGVVDDGNAALAGRIVSDRMFRTAVVRIAQARRSAPTWAYRFSWRSPVFGAAVHCVDVPFWFDCLDGPHVDALAGGRPPQALADLTHTAAVAFIRDGAPGWTAWSDAPGTARIVDLPVHEDPRAFASVAPLID